MRARYYNHASGRFITEDPIRDGSNWYSYRAGNPILRLDISGLKDGYVALRNWVDRKIENLDYLSATISWYGKTKTTTVYMSNDNDSSKASFKVGENGNSENSWPGLVTSAVFSANTSGTSTITFSAVRW